MGSVRYVSIALVVGTSSVAHAVASVVARTLRREEEVVVAARDVVVGMIVVEYWGTKEKDAAGDGVARRRGQAKVERKNFILDRYRFV